MTYAIATVMYGLPLKEVLQEYGNPATFILWSTS